MRRKRYARTVKVLKQHGKSNKRMDKRFPAMKPGKRVSKRGRTYYETRANRSDVRPFIRL